MIRVSLLRPDAPEWSRVLQGAAHDFYHQPAYVTLCGVRSGASPRALYVTSEASTMLLPLLIRDGLDAISPYGYSGPIGDAEFFSDALLAGLDHLRAEGLVTVFVRLHPILNPTPPSRVGMLVQHGDTVSIDLTRSTEMLWSETRAGHRTEIARAIRSGHRAFIDDRWEFYDSFKRMYLSTMERLDAPGSYHFDDAYFDALREALGSAIHLCVVDIGGSVAAAGLFIETRGLVQYHLSGSDDRFRKEGPTKLMLHFAREWAKERGDSRLHLGGGVGGAHDSLFMFKAGFSDCRHPFYTLRMVADETRYADLVRTYNAEADPLDLGGHFPRYRVPG